MRQNLVILNFGETPFTAACIENRLLTWFPLLAKTLGMPVFPLAEVESQLTAADRTATTSRCTPTRRRRFLGCSPVSTTFIASRAVLPAVTCGSTTRIVEDRVRAAADTFTAVSPAANRLVVFPSEEFHEAMPVRCPSRDFADSRFAVTTWLHRAMQPQGVEPKADVWLGALACGGRGAAQSPRADRAKGN